MSYLEIVEELLHNIKEDYAECGDIDPDHEHTTSLVVDYLLLDGNDFFEKVATLGQAIEALKKLKVNVVLFEDKNPFYFNERYDLIEFDVVFNPKEVFPPSKKTKLRVIKNEN